MPGIPVRSEAAAIEFIGRADGRASELARIANENRCRTRPADPPVEVSGSLCK